MNQEKIGKFIAKCRKNQKLTQEQLAEKLGVTYKAVSKWECGKGLPDASIMIDLCTILEISVNDLLSGEKIERDEFIDKADENLIKMKQSEERFEKEFNNIQKCFVIISIILGVIALLIFISHLVINYLNIQNYNDELFHMLFPIFIILTLVFSFIGYIIDFRKKYKIVDRK